MYGHVVYSAIIPYGDKKLRVNFRGGVIKALRGSEPATYTTDSEAYQEAIEGSAGYKKGKIKLVRKVLVGSAEDGTLPATTEADEAEAGTTVIVDEVISDESVPTTAYDGVRNKQQAQAVLTGEPYGVSLSDISTKASILAKAEELGISFPNWK